MRSSAAEICLDGSACLLAALVLLTLPLYWVFSAFLAAVIHELCHLLALSLTGISVRKIRIGICGAEIATAPLDEKTELICAAAGPAGSFFLLLLAHPFPRLALCGAFQGFFNMLPLYPLDGGRILHCLCAILLPEAYVERVAAVCEIVTLAAISGTSLYFSFSMGFFPICVAGILVLRVLVRKRPCKESKLAVQ